MRRPAVLLSILLSVALLTVLPAEAQHRQHHGQQGERGMMARSGMMQGEMMDPGMMQMMHGMHQRMMQNPMHRSAMTAFLLPALTDTLGLSDEQTSQLDSFKEELTNQTEANREQMAAHRQELMALFENGDRPAAEEVRQHLEEMAAMRADRQARLYETAEQMHEVLTDEQHRQLDDLSSHDQMHLLMSNMTMMDMMQMRRVMHGSRMGGMMNGIRSGMGPGMMNMRPDSMQQQMPMHRKQNDR